jgi:hypothetical protein
MDKNAVFTVCSANYLNKALVLMQSIDDSIQKIIVVADKKLTFDVNIGDVKLIFAEDLGMDRYYELAFKYNVIEFNTSIKPYIARSLLKDYRKVIYLDPDTYVFSGLDIILNELDNNSFILTPHVFSSFNDLERPSDSDILKFGLYNLGFFACSAGKDADTILSWWHNKLLDECFYEPGLGLGVDQKVAELIPLFFNGVKISQHLGLNVAFWNLHERHVALKDNDYYINETDKLIFAHFSSYCGSKIVASKQSRFSEGDRPDFLELLAIYEKKLNSSPLNSINLDSDYAYDYVKGYFITPLARRYYHHLLKAGKTTSQNPFECSELFDLLRSRKFILTNGISNAHVNFNDISTQGFSIRILTFVFKTILKILGPVRYFHFCRYINFITNTLNQKDILGVNK